MKVILRADASAQIGAGHLMRILVLSKELVSAGHEVIIWTCLQSLNSIGWLQEYLTNSGISCIDSENNELAYSLLEREQPDWLVVDSYLIDPRDIALARDLCKVLAIIDSESRGIDADLYLDQSSDIKNYSEIISSTLLDGPKYSLVRKDLPLFWNSESEITSQEETILIILGGSDASNSQNAVLSSLEKILRVSSIDFVSACPEKVSNSLQINKSINIHKNSADVINSLKRPTIVITAAGTSVLEFCTLGVPTIAIAVAKNQLSNMNSLERFGCVIGIDWTEEIDTDSLSSAVDKLLDAPLLRKRMSNNAIKHIDGLGAQRVRKTMESYLGPRDNNLKS